MTEARARIASGGTESEIVELGTGPYFALGIITPAAVTTSTAVTFKVARDRDGTFVPLYDHQDALLSATISTSAARAIAVPSHWFAGWQFLKLVVANAQGADRDFYVSSR